MRVRFIDVMGHTHIFMWQDSLSVGFHAPFPGHNKLSAILGSFALRCSASSLADTRGGGHEIRIFAELQSSSYMRGRARIYLRYVVSNHDHDSADAPLPLFSDCTEAFGLRRAFSA